MEVVSLGSSKIIRMHQLGPKENDLKDVQDRMAESVKGLAGSCAGGRGFEPCPSQRAVCWFS